MQALLRMKHWQLFLFTFCLYVIAGSISRSLKAFGGADVLVRFFSIIKVLGFLGEIFWAYSVIILVQKKFSTPMHHSTFTLRGCVYFVTLYHLLSHMVFRLTENRDLFVWIISWISFLCFLYVSYLAAYALVAAEKNENVKFRSLYLEFVAFLFFPIGVWWLQPRINNLLTQAPSKNPPPSHYTDR